MTDDLSLQSRIGAVAIGRNEGARLIACLDSLKGQVGRIVYVDSGSNDNSVAEAKTRGAEVIELDTDVPFTAARARNAGWRHLAENGQPPEFVQFLDGDCSLDPGWCEKGLALLDDKEDVMVVCGRRRERFPDASVYNRLIDLEWNTPVGNARACGGDALMRLDVLQKVGGFNPGLIAGEEPELCVRIRKAGGKIWRLDAEMTMHDAAITSVSEWWQRAKRAGHAYAEGAWLHGAAPERHYVPQLSRAVVWGIALPLLTLLSLSISIWLSLALLATWPLQVLRQFRSSGDLALAISMTACKIPEAQGVLKYVWRKITGKSLQIIEYK